MDFKFSDPQACRHRSEALQAPTSGAGSILVASRGAGRDLGAGTYTTFHVAREEFTVG